MRADEMLSEFGIGGKRPRTIAPDTLLAIKHHDVRDALDALYEPLPVEPGQWTSQACGDLLRRLYATIAQVEQLQQTIGQVTACRESAVRGMVNDIGPAGYEWPWES